MRRRRYTSSTSLEETLLGGAILAILVTVIAGLVWFFFLDIEHHQALVRPDANGVYKTWTVIHHYEVWDDYQSCTTTNKVRTCRTKYRWEQFKETRTAGQFRVDVVTPPHREVIKDCIKEPITVGCQRIREEYIYRVRLQEIKSIDIVWCNISIANWSDNFTVDSLWWINSNRAQGYLCHTLQKVQT